MASTTRLRQAFGSLRSSVELPQAQPLHRHLQHGLSPRSPRTFTSSTKCLARAGRNNSFVPSMPSMKTPSQKSMNVAIQEQKELAAMPDDIGFLPGTFIMPHGSSVPSLTSNFAGRYKLERARLIQRIKDLFSTTVMKFFYIRDPARKSLLANRYPRFRFPHLQRLAIPSIAQKLYEQMYLHFAKGTLDTLRPKLCESVYESLQGRVLGRPANTSLRWTLHRYLGSPRVVSHRLAPLTAGISDKTKQTALQQAVVRIRSMQSLQRIKKVKGSDGKVREVVEEGSSSKDGKEVVEYFVVQRMMRKGKMGEWKIWGTTEPTTLEKFEAEQKRRAGLA